MKKKSKEMKKLISVILILFSCYGMAQVLPTPTTGLQEDQQVTLGMVFKPKTNGQVTGVMYYRNFPGTVTGQLWTVTGTLLASTTFSDNSSGWKSELFSTPVNVAGGTEYIVSYFASAGQYYTSYGFFPKSFPLYDAPKSAYGYGSEVVFPASSFEASNYFVEPIFIPITPNPPTVLPRDTIIIIRDTCSIDYSKLNDLTFVLVLPDNGGPVLLPDSTRVYQAIFGAAQPHEANKDDIKNIIYRFQRTYTINKVATPVRFTMYKTGAWRRELKDSAGIWQNYPYAPY